MNVCMLACFHCRVSCALLFTHWLSRSLFLSLSLSTSWSTLQVGLGNFHRAHMATYMDDLLSKDSSQHSWGIMGGGVMSFDVDKRESLEPQDWLQVLVERDGETVEARVIGSMVDFCPVDLNHHAPLKRAMLNPNIKIVSLTVTESGYFLNPNTGKFDPNNQNIVKDLENPDHPSTIFGIMIQALKKRKESGVPPFTIMSCDNVPENGHVCKEVTLGLAHMVDPDMADWMEEHVQFPNSMVDRITPATSELERDYLMDQFGVEDSFPVFCEPFRQWVLEDKFSNGRPDLEQVGVQFVEDVHPFENMKIRILNGGHASLVYPSALLGLKFVHDAMEHKPVRAFLDALEVNEIIPTVGPVPDTNLSEYWKIIARRFSNPTMNDTVHRNAYDGSGRQPKFIIPVLKDNLVAGRSVDGLAIVSAMWCRYCQGATEAGVIVAPHDPQWDRLHQTALAAKKNPQIWLDMADIYGETGQHPLMKEAFAKAMRLIETKGIEATLGDYSSTRPGAIA